MIQQHRNVVPFVHMLATRHSFIFYPVSNEASFQIYPKGIKCEQVGKPKGVKRKIRQTLASESGNRISDSTQILPLET